MNEDTSRYSDIMHLPHPTFTNHPPMPMEKRAAQFSPFSAVAGHEEAIQIAALEHTARLEKQQHDSEVISAYDDSI